MSRDIDTKDEAGMTLIEIMIALAVFTVVMGFVLGFLAVAQRTFGTQQERSQANSQARLALEQLDREVRSGSVIRDPATDAPAYYTLRILTQANNENRCVQWRVTNERLERRQWEPSYGQSPDPATVSGWRVVAENVVNAQEGVPPFEAGVVTTGRVRTVTVTFLIDENPSDTDSMPVRVSQSLGARNTVFSFPQPPPGPYVGTSSEPCQPTP